jgi:hypothetical protein
MEGFMKKIFSHLTLVLFAALVAIICTSCNEKDPKSTRQKKDRAITIINKTGNRIEAYQVNTGSGVEIQKGTISKDSFSLIINRAFDNDPVIEVLLIDEYKKVYARSFEVSLEGNTDTPITKDDRKSEGMLKDRWRDAVEWFNKHK